MGKKTLEERKQDFIRNDNEKHNFKYDYSKVEYVDSTTKVCLICEKQKLIKVTNIKPKVSKKIKGIETLFLKSKIFDDEFLKEYTDYGIDYVIIEAPLLKSNNVNTVSVLEKFNGMISYHVYNTLGIVPEYISSYDARKYAFPDLMAIRTTNKKGEKIPLNKLKKVEPTLFGAFPTDIDKKVIIFEHVKEKFPDIKWEYNKKDELLKCNYDSSDAITCILGWIGMQKQ